MIDMLKWIALVVLVLGIVGGLVMWSRYGASGGSD